MAAPLPCYFGHLAQSDPSKTHTTEEGTLVACIHVHGMRMKSLPLGVPLLARSLHAIARSSMPSSWPPPSRPPAVCLAPFYQKIPCCILRLCMCISVGMQKLPLFAALVHALPSLLVLCMTLLQSHIGLSSCMHCSLKSEPLLLPYGLAVL